MFSHSKSPETFNDSNNNISLIRLDTINQNILYLTHEVDKCVSLLETLNKDNHLQKQVDEYFEEAS